MAATGDAQPEAKEWTTEELLAALPKALASFEIQPDFDAVPGLQLLCLLSAPSHLLTPLSWLSMGMLLGQTSCLNAFEETGTCR